MFLQRPGIYIICLKIYIKKYDRKINMGLFARRGLSVEILCAEEYDILEQVEIIF